MNSLTSVSLEPALIAFCPSRASLTWRRMRHANRFAVNILGHRHEQYARRATPAGADRFADLDWTRGSGGAPLLRDALASIECDIAAEHPAGDHWIVVGRVRALHVSSAQDPLLYFGGAFVGLGATP